MTTMTPSQVGVGEDDRLLEMVRSDDHPASYVFG